MDEAHAPDRPDARDDTGDGLRTDHTRSGGAPPLTGCYDCRDDTSHGGATPRTCESFECDTPQPCEDFVLYDEDMHWGIPEVLEPPAYKNTDAGGRCILEALRAGTPGRYTIERNPGHQFSDTRTLYVLADRRAVELYEEYIDLVSSFQQRVRRLRDPQDYDACFEDVDAMWECLRDPLDDAACYTNTLPSCPGAAPAVALTTRRRAP